MKLQISVIIAVYERESELRELLESLAKQTYKDFEVVVVDDGSKNQLIYIVEDFITELKIKYFYKPNSGPGLTRNYGMKKANGNFYVFFDSDTIVLPDYMEKLVAHYEQEPFDFYGGVDTASNDFSDLQKAINFAMTSFVTTGGIRSAKNDFGKFQPRSFNMGISKEAFEASGGFKPMRVGEDPDLTMTLWENGFKSKGFRDLKVYHKRRATLPKFAKQVKSFGRARPILNKLHPSYVKFTFWLPTFFILGLLLSFPLVFLGCPYLFYSYIFYFLFVFIISSVQNKSIKVGGLSIVTVFLQFWNYGIGFFESQIRLNLFNQHPQEAFPNHF